MPLRASIRHAAVGNDFVKDNCREHIARLVEAHDRELREEREIDGP
jgi:hypothetical protein